MHFRVTGLSIETFRHLINRTPAELEENGARRYTVERNVGYPDRITLSDVPIGETVLLLNYVHQPSATPYHASHAIFVWERAPATYNGIDELPPALRSRMLSLRAFDATHMMVDADLVSGQDAERAIVRLLTSVHVSYIQAHYAQRGCYAARIEPALRS